LLFLAKIKIAITAIFWCIFTTKLELTLSKIFDKEKIAAHFARGIPIPAVHPTKRRGTKPVNFFLFLLRGTRKIRRRRTIKEKICGLCFLADARRAASHPVRLSKNAIFDRFLKKFWLI
jgi:hypothetical protein